MSQQLCVVDLKNYLEGLQIVNQIPEAIDIVDYFAVSNKAVLILIGESTALNAFCKRMKFLKSKYYFTSDFQTLLKAHQSIELSAMQNVIYTFKSKLASEVFSVAHDFLKNGFKIIDFKIQRIDSADHFFVATSDKLDGKLKFLEKSKKKNVTSIFVSQKLKNFFDFSEKV